MDLGGLLGVGVAELVSETGATLDAGAGVVYVCGTTGTIGVLDVTTGAGAAELITVGATTGAAEVLKMIGTTGAAELLMTGMAGVDEVLTTGAAGEDDVLTTGTIDGTIGLEIGRTDVDATPVPVPVGPTDMLLLLMGKGADTMEGNAGCDWIGA